MSKKNILLLLGVILISGCAPGQMAMSSSDVRIQYKWPVVEIDRYEPVVFPAGPKLQRRL